MTFPHSGEGGVSSQGWTDGGQWRGVKIYVNSLRLHFHSALEKEAHLRVSFAPSAESSSLPGDGKKARKKGAACGPLRPFPTPLRRFPYKGPQGVAPEARQPARLRPQRRPQKQRGCPAHSRKEMPICSFTWESPALWLEGRVENKKKGSFLLFT